VLIRSLPFGLFIGVMVLEPLLRSVLPAGVDPRWLYGLRSGLALLALVALWGKYAELREARKPSPGDWVLAAGVGALVFGAWVNLDVWPLALAPGTGFDPFADGRVHPGLAAMRLAGATLIVPLMEELFWRSFVLRWLHRPSFLNVDPRAVGWRALLLSSVLFATEHRLWVAGLLAGLAYGWLYRRTGNLWPSILAHATTNGLLGAYVLTTGAWRFW
jgi:CAAX prenyl protease-like protein